MNGEELAVTNPSSPPWLKPLVIGAAVTAGAIVLAPYILPYIGIGTEKLAINTIVALHSEGVGTGIAGGINSVLSAVPIIGNSLAQGGVITAVTSGIIGIGGVLLGNHMQKCEDGSTKISYGKLIRTASLLTSALIALPSLLTGLGIGLTYIAAALGNRALADSLTAIFTLTTGTMGAANVGPSVTAGAIASLPHIVTCGSSIIPSTIAYTMGNDKQKDLLLSSTHHNKYTDGSISIQLETDTPPLPGKPVHARIKLLHAHTGKPITNQELAVKFTERMHVLIIDQSMKDYQHVHPKPTGSSGEFTFTFTPKTPNSYNVWTDIQLLSDSKSHRLKSLIPSPLAYNMRPALTPNNAAETDNLKISWKSDKPLRQNIPSTIEVNVTDKAGKPVTNLEPVMGTFAHLVGFSADGKSLIHTHPIGDEPTSEFARGGATLRFHVVPDFDGAAQFYLQLKHNNKESFAAFAQQIAPQEMMAQKYTHRHAHGQQGQLSPGLG